MTLVLNKHRSINTAFCYSLINQNLTTFVYHTQTLCFYSRSVLKTEKMHLQNLQSHLHWFTDTCPTMRHIIFENWNTINLMNIHRF